MVQHGDGLKTQIPRFSDDGGDLLRREGCALPAQLGQAFQSESAPEFYDHVGVAQCGKKADALFELKQSRFGKYAEVSHTQFYFVSAADNAAGNEEFLFLCEILGLDASDKVEESAHKRFPASAAHGDAVFVYVDLIFLAVLGCKNGSGADGEGELVGGAFNIECAATEAKAVPHLGEKLGVKEGADACVRTLAKNKAFHKNILSGFIRWNYYIIWKLICKYKKRNGLRFSKVNAGAMPKDFFKRY